MIVLGIDPGARWTGFAVISSPRGMIGIPTLIESHTIANPAPQGSDLLDLPGPYLADVSTAILDLRQRLELDVVALEWIRRPSWRTGGKVKPLDPTAILATAIVAGVAVEAHARAYPPGCPLERVRPDGNGRLLPLPHYPAPLGTTGKGTDKRRHERSAYDVAMMGAQQHRTGRNHR